MIKNKNIKNEKTAPECNTITNCTFNGVQFDAKAVDAISLIATGLIENAKALGSLASVLKASNINIESMLKIGGPK
jgi:hypothetical protein